MGGHMEAVADTWKRRQERRLSAWELRPACSSTGTRNPIENMPNRVDHSASGWKPYSGLPAYLCPERREKLT